MGRKIEAVLLVLLVLSLLLLPCSPLPALRCLQQH